MARVQHRVLSFVIPALLLFSFGALSCGDEGGHVRDISDAHFLQTDGGADPPFTITQLQPDHGPVAGGTIVTVRGFGFAAESRVYFGDMLVDPDWTSFEGTNRIVVKAPPGNVGPSDVTVLRPDGERAVFENGYTYDLISLDPNSGSINGGTFVRLHGVGTDFAGDDIASIGGEDLDYQIVVNPELITGFTEAHAPGLVSVNVTGPGRTLTVNDAFTYYDSADPINGGLGGGKIEGEVNITVLDSYSSEPITGVYVLMGSGPTSPYQAITDATGRVTFSAPGLVGPQMVTCAADGYERVSIVAFDARDVTVFMTPEVPPSSGTIPGQNWSTVSGFVSFADPEFGADCDFDRQVPEAGPGERRIIKMYQTVGDYDYWTSEPGTSGIIVDGDDCISAYAYSIFARPGSYAVYALAGIEDMSTGVFTPYAMGVARNLISGPNQAITADVMISFGLGQQLAFDYSPAPALNPSYGPVGYRLSVFVDLGGDGYIVQDFLERTSVDASDNFVINKLPELSGALSDANYSALIEAHNNGYYPFAKVYRPVLNSGPTPNLIDQWVGIPVATDPLPGGTPSSNRLVWSAPGNDPTFNVILVRSYPEGVAYWRLYLHGSVRQMVLPDLFGLGDGLDGHPSGRMIWHVLPIKVDGMDFNDFSYRYLSDRYWNAWAGDAFLFNFPDPE